MGFEHIHCANAAELTLQSKNEVGDKFVDVLISHALDLLHVVVLNWNIGSNTLKYLKNISHLLKLYWRISSFFACLQFVTHALICAQMTRYWGMPVT